MKRIGLLSDTHGYLDPKIKTYFSDVDEIWHAGDIGTIDVLDELKAFKPTRAVWGNIDNHQIRQECKEFLRFKIEEVEILMTHIGGKPERYSKPAFGGVFSRTSKKWCPYPVCLWSFLIFRSYDIRTLVPKWTKDLICCG